MSPDSSEPRPSDGQSPQGSPAAGAPSISLPKGGGAIRGIGEKFAANPVTGTGSTTVPIAVSPGRSGFGPQLALSYDSGAGNGAFGFGWNLSLPSITRKTDKGLPRYWDGEESDVFILSGAEDLVPIPVVAGAPAPTLDGYRIQRYRPRIEGLFARIERWTEQATGDIHWHSISRDNITTLYGKTAESRIADPADPQRVFSWLICESYDDKGNAVVYRYAEENDENVDRAQVNERNRVRTGNRYVKRICYGNQISRLVQPDLAATKWLFEVVFDYDEDHYEALPPDSALPEDQQHELVLVAASPGLSWAVRPDPWSSYRPGFEVRTYRRCRRVLMFHHFDELGDEPYLVRCTEFDYADFDYAQPTTIEAELAHPGSTRFASFIRSVTQSGFIRDGTRAMLERNGVKYLTYVKRSLPPLEFEYSKASIQDEIRELDASSLENLPIGLDGTAYQWVDLDGEGVTGILTEQAGSWFYKPNLGEGRFGSLHQVAATPSLAVLGSGRQQLIDLAGDGRLDLVALAGPTPGFYKRTHNEDWESLKPFTSLPNLAWDEPNLRFVDLNGDGHADVLITEHDVFTWHPSLAEQGFGPARQVRQPADEERGPRLVLMDGTQSIYLADMCGDGLTDLVRIRNGEVCYWPNLGYGRFGVKVTMDDVPWFDHPDQFDQRCVRLADIDGSGTNDIVYLGGGGVHIYFNASGNSWSQPRRLRQFPSVDNLSSVMTADLLGNGTACLVWSSPLPGEGRRPLRFIDLMGGQKPHLLVKTINNLGAETHIQYISSTHFYLQDKAAGTPWVAKLPFPVHVVERMETYDRISCNRFVTRYAYHHGHFDGVEREFRGFGLVEQFDTEEFAALSTSDDFPTGDNIDTASHVPPVHTKTWFHTGNYLGRDHVSDFFAGLLDDRDKGEYYREPGLTDPQARQLLLDDTELPTGLTVEEEREACRALKGAMLRQEVYALDDTDKAAHPYVVTEQNFTIRVLQRRGNNCHAVFVTHAHEAISYHYERNPDDPRITHALTLEVDGFGNALKEAAIGYGRRQPDPALPLPEDQDKQTKTLITYTENHVTNPIDDPVLYPDDYRAPLPCETRTYELTGYPPTGVVGRFQSADFVQPASDGLTHIFDTEINYEDPPTNGRQRRLIEQVRTLYRPDDLGATQNDPLTLLPLGTVQPLALPGESYKLAFTPGLLAKVYQRPRDAVQPPGEPPPENLLPNPVNVLGGQGPDRGGYRQSEDLKATGAFPTTDPDGHWWIPADRVFVSPQSGDTPAQELAEARQHFFLPHRYRDPFHTNAVSTESVVTYDTYDLLMVATRDALGNVVTVATTDDTGNTAIRIDYRVLQPYWVTDPNGNRTRVAFDSLGMVVGTAVMGQPPPAPVEGDSLDAFDADLTEVVILGHLENPLADPQAILRRATTRLVYDLFAYQRTKNQPNPQPAVVYTLVRETHEADLGAGQQTEVQHSFSYSDGFCREIQKKIQAEAGPVPVRDEHRKIVVSADGQPEMTPNDFSPRWVGSGCTIFNNKNKPVRQYEPFFTDTPAFEFDVRIGVSPVLFYDPVGRVVATLHPNHTWEKVVFDAWRQESSDASDTVLVADPTTDPDVGDYFRRLPDGDYLPTWYTQRQSGVLALDPQEQGAARKTAIHADTPAVTQADSLGRTFLTVAHNKFKYSNTLSTDPPTEEFYRTRVHFDIEGNQRQVSDAKDRIVMRYDYDMLGNPIHQASMDAGERWMLNDVAGKPLYAWDSRNHRFRITYDALRRPTDSFLREGAEAELRVGRTLYGESWPNPGAKNPRGKPVQLFDQAGVVTSDEYDFKGNSLSSQRQLAQEYKTTLNWATVPLEAEIYTSSSRFDALNRLTELATPHTPDMQPSVIRPGYNKANLLERIDANLHGAQSTTSFVTDSNYDAKGQRTLIDYGNDARTIYEYDPLTFRLAHLRTLRGAARLQDLLYTYDPTGNITSIRDDAQQTIYFDGQVIEPHCDYVYDALYRLINATGREHIGQLGQPETTWNDEFRVNLQHPHDGQAMRNYIEQYVYDAVGNFETLIHQAVNGGWTRAYTYTEPSLFEPDKTNNRLSSTNVHLNGNQPIVEPYTHDAHGNMTSMFHLSKMEWNFKDQLQVTSKQVVNNGGTPETTYYVYGKNGQRVRKVTERQNGTRKNERTYLNGFELYREYDGGGTSVGLQRETLHVMDDKRRIVLVERRITQGHDNSPEQLIRYQLANHLYSASLELDDDARIISYEEYYPYGSTSYQAVRSQTETPKRYRYTDKERDDDSGLNYHGARYLAPWLGSFVSVDPHFNQYLTRNPYCYAADNPITLSDPTGQDPIKASVKLLDNINAIDEAVEKLDQTVQGVGKLGPLTTAYNKAKDAYDEALHNLPLVGGRDDTSTSEFTELRNLKTQAESRLIDAKRVAVDAGQRLKGIKQYLDEDASKLIEKLGKDRLLPEVAAQVTALQKRVAAGVARIEEALGNEKLKPTAWPKVELTASGDVPPAKAVPGTGAGSRNTKITSEEPGFGWMPPAGFILKSLLEFGGPVVALYQVTSAKSSTEAMNAATNFAAGTTLAGAFGETGAAFGMYFGGPPGAMMGEFGGVTFGGVIGSSATEIEDDVDVKEAGFVGGMAMWAWLLLAL
jgi:RHS repeat-associated protein